MTDDQILERLAAIEGWVSLHGVSCGTKWFARAEDFPRGPWMNPLTNDAQAMALVKKHKLTVLWWDSYTSIKEEKRNKWSAETETSCAEDASLNRAICLAVIEANP